MNACAGRSTIRSCPSSTTSVAASASILLSCDPFTALSSAATCARWIASFSTATPPDPPSNRSPASQNRTLSPIPPKGLHTLLDALAHLPSQSWYLTIIGSADVDRAYTRLVRRQIAALDLSTRVTFLHAASDEMLVTALPTSHVMAVPSSYEGFGIAYLEGMAFGLPAIATTGGAAGEIIAHGETGFLISPGDVASLAGCLRLLLEDRPRLLAMSLAARQRFDHHPTWAQTAARIRAFIQRMQRVETAVRLSGW